MRLDGPRNQHHDPMEVTFKNIETKVEVRSIVNDEQGMITTYDLYQVLRGG